MVRNLLPLSLGNLAGIQYVGRAGISMSCHHAVKRLLQYGEKIERALILSAGGHHALLLTIEMEGLVAVKAGFSSGYPGEGPRTFAEVLTLLQAFYVEIDECQVTGDLLNRLEASALTSRDLETIEATPFVRPMRWHDYVYAVYRGKSDERPVLGTFREVMPWAVIDNRITDLALRFFESADGCILSGFRRLEEFVRQKSGLDEHGVKLMQQAFLRDDPRLVWEVKDPGEQKGRAQLFVGAFMAYRNPRAHRELGANGVGMLTEFLMLNQLYLLEREAVKAEEVGPAMARNLKTEDRPPEGKNRAT